MSITQDYEEIKKRIGVKKYSALDRYIQKFGKNAEWNKGIKEIRPIEDIKQWEEKYFELHEKCKPIFIEDVVMNKEEWNKFENWYNNEKNKHKKRGAR